jgi:hypothetical protein
VETYKAAPEAGPLDDEFLKVAAKLHSAFESAGLLATEGEYLAQAVKALVKVKARHLLPGVATPGNGFAVRKIRLAGGGVAQIHGDASDPLGSLVGSLKKLEALKAGGLDDEENVQDELATARKALKALGITADDTPAGLRRRALHLVKALALGEEYPAPAVATEDQAKQYRVWIADLGHESIETRETATKELLRAGETALPFAREVLKSTDVEVASRARLILGFTHAPWTRKAESGEMHFGVVLPAPAVAPAPPKEEKDKDKAK